MGLSSHSLSTQRRGPGQDSALGRVSWLFALGSLMALLLVPPAVAAPVVVDPSITLSVYDTGGFLNPSLNGGYYFGGLEVDPAGGAVHFSQSNASPGGTSTRNRLAKSTGLGTAAAVPGQALNWGNRYTRGNDLTLGPDGRYYVATDRGIYGYDATGALPPSPFAPQAWGALASSGLTFDPAGTTALVSTDSPAGLYQVQAGGPTTQTHGQSPAGGYDDHVVTSDGRTLIIDDSSRRIYEALPGGAWALRYDLRTDPDVAPFVNAAGNGSRGAIDPVTGDIYIGYSFGPSPSPVVRLKADLSDAEVVATDFYLVRDLDIGPGSSGDPGARSLYVAEDDLPAGIGTIYELELTPHVPQPKLSVTPTEGNPVDNGSFETGDYTAWTLYEGPPGPPPFVGIWGIVSDGQTVTQSTPLFDFHDGITTTSGSPGLPITYAATDGSKLAVQLQNGGQYHEMYQDIEVPLGATSLSWDMMYTNHDGPFVVTTDPLTQSGQFLAVRIRDLSDNLLDTLFVTDATAPMSMPMTHHTADISAHAGSSVRLSVEMDVDRFFFDAAFDDFALDLPASTYGYARIGETLAKPITVTNTGDPGSTLSGGFPAAAGPFEPATLQPFGPLGQGESEDRMYLFRPTDHGLVTEQMTVTSNAGEVDVTLSGYGVGPAFDSSVPPFGTIDFGRVMTGDVEFRDLMIGNATADPDGGDTTLTDLTIRYATIAGPGAAHFSVSGVTPDMTIARGESRLLQIGFTPWGDIGPREAWLVLYTDQGEPFGQAGDRFGFRLTGFVVPEPSTLALCGIGAFTLLRRHRRR